MAPTWAVPGLFFGSVKYRIYSKENPLRCETLLLFLIVMTFDRHQYYLQYLNNAKTAQFAKALETRNVVKLAEELYLFQSFSLRRKNLKELHIEGVSSEIINRNQVGEMQKIAAISEIKKVCK